MKNDYEVKEISKELALNMVQKYHYSNTLPKLNKHFIGFYLNNKLVGVVTLGWGTRPLHTIKKIFPSLETKDYYEIGRMCMTEEMPRNSESQMISKLIRWIKENECSIKVLFTWADGVMGKPGYVYQSCSFLYGGYSLTDIYLKDGIKIHPRQTRALFIKDENDKRKTIRPTLQQMKENNMIHIRGKQFKYLTFLCSKTEKKKLMKECLLELNTRYPKQADLYWEKQIGKGSWEKCDKPYYKTDFNQDNKEIVEINSDNNIIEGQMNIFDFINE